mmetsp:Transcript_27939/g.65100  ORF Transcript_27939/g.65100 Transcript_27939/m.65100 type:complete len:164 (-) Transcript_27939:28-519(-)
MGGGETEYFGAWVGLVARKCSSGCFSPFGPDGCEGLRSPSLMYASPRRVLSKRVSGRAVISCSFLSVPPERGSLGIGRTLPDAEITGEGPADGEGDGRVGEALDLHLGNTGTPPPLVFDASSGLWIDARRRTFVEWCLVIAILPFSLSLSLSQIVQAGHNVVE